MEAVTLTTAIRAYREFLEHEQHASATTRAGYGSYLKRFQRFLTERHGRDLAVAEVSTDDVRAYLYHLSRAGLRPRTLHTALYPVRGLLALAVERGWAAMNVARAVKLPKKDAAKRQTVSDEELEQLLNGCEREPDAERRPMMKAVLAVLIYAGLRRQELLDLTVADVDLRERKIAVQSGKGAKSRALYVCEPCVQALREWLAVRPKTNHTYLFITDTRRRLGEDGLRRLVEDAKCLADLRGREGIKPHSMRHAAATRLLRNGADLRSIQHFLGHSNLQTTAIYLHTDEQQLQRIAELGAFPPTPAQREADHPPQRSARASQPPYRRRRIEPGDRRLRGKRGR